MALENDILKFKEVKDTVQIIFQLRRQKCMNKRIITILFAILIPIFGVSGYYLGIRQSNDTPNITTNAKSTSVSKKTNWDSDLSNIREFVSQQQTQQTKAPEPSEASEVFVYVTPHGEKYHRKNCRYIQNSTPSKISVSDAIDEGYTACKVCKPNK